MTEAETRSPNRTELADEALKLALRLDSDWWLPRALGRVAPLLSADQIERALAAVRALNSAHTRANCLIYMAYHLPAEQQAAAAEEALADALALEDEGQRQRLLRQLMGILPPGRRQALAENALRAMPQHSDPGYREWGVWALAAALPEADRHQAVAVARTFEDPIERLQALALLATLLPEPRQAELLAEAVALARSADDPEACALGLAGLLYPSAQAERPALALEALKSAVATENDQIWVDVLEKVVPYLAGAALEAPLEHAQRLPDAGPRAAALGLLAPALPPDAREAVIETALADASALDDWAQTDLLRGLAEHLSADTRAQALRLARAQTDPWARAEALAWAAKSLPDHLRRPILTEGLEAARSCANAWNRVYALAAVCDQWPE
jgi:hypothetical protein